MRSFHSRVYVLLFGAVFGMARLCVWAQDTTQERIAAPAPPPLIVDAIDESRLTTLKGNTHPLARPEFDLGTAPASLPMQRMLLVLKRSPEQESALRKLLDDQQDKNSPNYHKWLSPEQFGKQFGPTDNDIQVITGWLQSHGFEVGATKGRTILEFSGSASQVREAFHTTIHKYLVNGEQHWANASDPQIPAALTRAIAGVLTLHNFIKKPPIHFSGDRIPATSVGGKKPQVSFPAQNGQPATNALSPQDFAVIYNINPVYKTIDGTGVTIGVVGRSDLYSDSQDVFNFRDIFGLSLNVPKTILDGPDPGDLGGGEEVEATLDTTWSGAIAPQAIVDLVVSATTNTTDGADLSETYIVENNLADVMTESFSACELFATDTQLAGASALAEQAAAQGITYFVSAGDDGAEGCDDPSAPPASHPISVNYLASTAFNVAVGGTMFNENGNTSKYWTSVAPFAETAISYIPEDVWNESSLKNGLWSGSGGASAGNVQAGGTTKGIPKPSWQSGVAGIPGDGVRDLPDVSLTAAEHDPYLLCVEDSCVANSQGQIFVLLVGGTSASAPSFAGIMALVDQQMGGRQGLANFVLYRLAAMQSSYPSQCDGSNSSTPPASTCIFNDVTSGNNSVPGEAGYPNGLYSAGVGYDQATGLGSVNVANLVTNWNTVTFNPTKTTLALDGGATVNIEHGQAVPLQAVVSPSSGSGIPTGNLELLTGDGLAPATMGVFALANGQVISSTSDLPGSGNANYNVWAHYGGDSTYAPSDSTSVAVTVSPEPSTTTVSLLTANQSGQPIPFTGGPFGSFVYLRADVSGQSGFGTPTGTVTFSDAFGPIPYNPIAANLNSQANTSTPSGIPNFDAGTHTISATYSGDPSFKASRTTQSKAFTISPGFFAITAGGQGQVVIGAPGGSSQGGVNVFYSTGFTGTIMLSCGGLPVGAACVFHPPTIVAPGTSSMTESAIIVTTTAATTSLGSAQTGKLMAQWMISTGLVVSLLCVSGKQSCKHGLVLLFVLAVIVVVPSCGGGGSSTPPPPPPPSPTPAGTYNVTVAATSGGVSSSAGFTLIVQ